MSKSSTLVYSTATGRICEGCAKPIAACECSKKKGGTPAVDGYVRIRRETKGRNGKGVTLIEGLPLTADELVALTRTLKSKCGSGGTVKDGIIEMQGDHRNLLQTHLQHNGYRVKLAGA
jgi:translation initiation factor 1